MECPLPIDWLDWLEDPSDQLLAEHLESCTSCRMVISLLRASDSELRGPELPRVPSPPFGHPKAGDASAAADELWITAPADTGLDGALVLVLADRHREFDRDWYEIAALDTAIEQATEFDLLIEPAETNLNVPLRLRFDLQGYVAASDVRVRAGALTDGGKAVVRAAVDGTADESRWGLALEGPYDDRLNRFDRGAAAIQQLQVLYRTRAAAAEDPELTLAAVLKEARNQCDLSRAAISEKLAHRLGLAELAAKVKRYYADLENGLLNPAGLRPALLTGLAQTLSVPRQQLEGLRDAWTPPASAGAAPVFARSASSTAPTAHGNEEAWDAVDDLFFGGSES